MSDELDEMKHFNIWMLEGVAYQLSQQFVSTFVEDKESCSACLYRLTSIWSHLVAMIPEIGINTRLMNWIVLCDLITVSSGCKDLTRLEALIGQLEQQKCLLKINDNISCEVFKFLHTMVSMYYHSKQNIRKARNHMLKNEVLYKVKLSKFLDNEITLPDVLEIGSLQSHISPYVRAVIKTLGKPRLSKVISRIMGRNDKSGSSKSFIDAVLSENLPANVASKRNLFPVNDAVEVNCNEVSSSCEDITIMASLSPLRVSATNSAMVKQTRNKFTEITPGKQKRKIDFKVVSCQREDNIEDLNNVSREEIGPSSTKNIVKEKTPKKKNMPDSFPGPSNTSIASVDKQAYPDFENALPVHKPNDLSLKSDLYAGATCSLQNKKDSKDSSLRNTELTENNEPTNSAICVSCVENGVGMDYTEACPASKSLDEKGRLVTDKKGATSSPSLTIDDPHCSDEMLKKYMTNKDLTIENKQINKHHNLEDLSVACNKESTTQKDSSGKRNVSSMQGYFSPSKKKKPREENKSQQGYVSSGKKKLIKTRSRSRNLPQNTENNDTVIKTSNSSGKSKDDDKESVPSPGQDISSGETLQWSSEEDVGEPLDIRRYKENITQQDRPRDGKKRLNFTEEEEGYLIEGIQRYGVGNWRKILNTYPFHQSRTNVNIKDKYRNLVKRGVIIEE